MVGAAPGENRHGPGEEWQADDMVNAAKAAGKKKPTTGTMYLLIRSHADGRGGWPGWRSVWLCRRTTEMGKSTGNESLLWGELSAAAVEVSVTWAQSVGLAVEREASPLTTHTALP
jgi:hypothetical protein